MKANIEKNYKDPIEMDPRKANSLNMFRKDSKMASLLPPSEAYTKYNADLLTSKTQIIAKIVSGQMSVDEGLQKYANDNKDAIQAILNDFNKAK